MTALAIYLKEAGYEVSGSDTSEHFVTDELLKKNHIPVFDSFNEKNLISVKYDLVISSAAYDKDNPEAKEALKRKLNLIYYSEALGQISSGKKLIAVSGIHGKTTITAIIAYLFEKSGLDPSYLIGAGQVPNLKASAHKGEGEYFVMEADEYRKCPGSSKPKFLDLNPRIAVISSIELDHPDMFPTIEEVYNAFYSLACRIPREGFIVLCLDYTKAKKMVSTLADRNFETYGFDPSARWRIISVKPQDEEISFNLESMGKIYGPFVTKLAGNHNVLNATAAIICALKIGISEEKIKKLLPDFETVKRRFELVAKIGQITIIDDYAHHPTAISATIEAAKRKYTNAKIWCIFQPHTYSRTQVLLEKFATCFKNADHVIVTDIFASARENAGEISGADLAAEIKKHQGKVRYIPFGAKIAGYIGQNIKEPAVVLTLGAGDIYKLGDDLKKAISERKKIG